MTRPDRLPVLTAVAPAALSQRTASRLFGGLLLALALLGMGAPALAQTMVSAAGNPVNLRALPSTNSEVLWQLQRGYPLQVLGEKDGWLQVRDFENDRGWVLKSLTGNAPHHVVSNATANVRSGPGTNHSLVTTLQRGELLRTLEQRGDWVRVARVSNGQSGWISKPLLWGF